jgi:hypothetical protein
LPRISYSASITEGKNGLGPVPLKTEKGWLHLAHGVRDCAAGVLYTGILSVGDWTAIKSNFLWHGRVWSGTITTRASCRFCCVVGRERSF